MQSLSSNMKGRVSPTIFSVIRILRHSLSKDGGRVIACNVPTQFVASRIGIIGLNKRKSILGMSLVVNYLIIAVEKDIIW